MITKFMFGKDDSAEVFCTVEYDSEKPQVKTVCEDEYLQVQVHNAFTELRKFLSIVDDSLYIPNALPSS